MKLTTNEVLAIQASLEKIGKLKGLANWKDVLLNKALANKVGREKVAEFDSQRKEILESLCEMEGDKPKIVEDKYVFIDDNEAKAVEAVGELGKRFGESTLEVAFIELKLEDFDSVKPEPELLEPLLGTLINAG